MPQPLFLLVALVPLLPALAALPVGALDGRRARSVAGMVTTATALLAVAAAAVLAWRGAPGLWHFGAGVWSVTVRFDLIAAGMVLLVGFLGWTIGRFATRYLAEDAGEARFHRSMLLTLASVLALVIAGNLVVFFAAWVSSSAALHALLRYYPERRGATLAARKKFVISRLGDLCLIAAGVLLWRAYGTTEFEALFAAVAVRPEPADLPALLLAAGAAIKSAQVPFHWWLPETMETPTPVSALMHAGIINAGGFLVIRLSPLFNRAPAALAFLAVLGGVTAAFGAVVMLTQPAVKRALAYSTIAQMGFMMLECGLGAYGLAFLHLIAHSLYKAHAFLSSGSTVGAVPRAAVPLRPSALAAGIAAAAVLVAGVAAVLPTSRVDAVFLAGLGLAIAYGLARAWSVLPRAGERVLAFGAAAAFAGVTAVLHRAVAVVLPSGPEPAAAVVAFIGAVFVGLFLMQALVARADRHAWSRALYVHALNGFYVGTLARRVFARASDPALPAS